MHIIYAECNNNTLIVVLIIKQRLKFLTYIKWGIKRNIDICAYIYTYIHRRVILCIVNVSDNKFVEHIVRVRSYKFVDLLLVEIRISSTCKFVGIRVQSTKALRDRASSEYNIKTKITLLC